MLVWILISVIVAAIALYFLFRDANSNKIIGGLPSDNNDSSNSSVINPIIPIHNIPGSIVTASSYNDNLNYNGNLVPEEGRMNSNNYWQPSYDDNNIDDPWIQFTFPDRYEFSSIQIKYNSSIGYKLNTVDILFPRDDEGKIWEKPIRIHGPFNNPNAELNHTFNPTVKSKIIRIKIISGALGCITSTRLVPIKVGLQGRLVK